MYGCNIISSKKGVGTVDWGDDKTIAGVSCNEIEYTSHLYTGNLTVGKMIEVLKQFDPRKDVLACYDIDTASEDNHWYFDIQEEECNNDSVRLHIQVDG